MQKLIGNAIVGQSGGPTAAINATLAGVVRGAQESNVIGKTVVLHEKLNVFAAFWAIDEVWTAPFKNLIPAFCENALKTKLISPFC